MNPINRRYGSGNAMAAQLANTESEHSLSAAAPGYRKQSYWLVVAASVLSIAAISVSYAQAGLPATQSANGTEYVTGGFGENGADAFKQAESSFPLTLVFAEDAGGGSRPYVAEVSVVVKKDNGELALEVPSAGPYLLVKLKPGNYRVEATYMGQTKTQDVKISDSQPTRHVMAWKTHGK